MLGAIIRPGSTVSGQTPEHGTVKVEDEKTERREFEKGVIQERVGFYKLTRQKNLLVISHFWKSDLGTQSETELAPEWALALDRAGSPDWFGERAVKPVFRLPLGGPGYRRDPQRLRGKLGRLAGPASQRRADGRRQPSSSVTRPLFFLYQRVYSEAAYFEGAFYASCQTEGIPEQGKRQIRQHYALRGLYGPGDRMDHAHTRQGTCKDRNGEDRRCARDGCPAGFLPCRPVAAEGGGRRRYDRRRDRARIPQPVSGLRNGRHAAFRQPLQHDRLRRRVAGGR